MCTWSYLHHHHLYPCTREIDMVVHYAFCRSAPVDTAGSQLPCDNLTYDHTQAVDYNNPCATGGCLASPDCSSGACRLEQLNGRWICCQCNRGANEYRWCRHRRRGSPDTFCYHVCCAGCREDSRSSRRI
ncbi:hypothetical protein B0T26DRAFT_637442 [Lasiosphaeria miniovina]|uniref:Uncharacterized protein n=2 Tax=Lasiosphaeria TaxID=92901 RepID=A0AA40B4D3_9PEZI|nr:uncharacterized protein B0T26DRAFT_637442 [Lasiosphaeria miniovina]KAK0727484.1 hypothetical protein B0T26DRAFT_637442 [Lasiosphaeria miniovina]KAK3366136.1 hypothetical protein B0T24DRAFT_711566 [Lasiosphaeria ovina]